MANASYVNQCLTSQARLFTFLVMNLTLLGNSLKDGRAKRGWTLREAEEHTGVSNAFLSQLEGGKIKKPSPNVLHKLCEVFELSYALTMEYAGYPVPEEAQLNSDEKRFFSRLGRTSSGEQEALLDYLNFLRTKRR
jgi:HTH-type transcriptional regulator, competence development regulator